jgi:hypothetical protein
MLLSLPDSTVCDALCALAHELEPLSEAYCIRHHPHDAQLELSMGGAELARAGHELVRRMGQLACEELSEERCRVRCPSFLMGNLVRRSLLLVDVLACTSVEIRVNSSRFEDAQIAHRFGQLAIRGDAIEASAKVSVRGRTLLGEDIRFAPEVNASVCAADRAAPLVPLRGQERFEASLFFARGTALEHAKFCAVVAPSYEPEVRLARAGALPIGYSQRELLVSRDDGTPVRAEVLREAGLEVRLGPGVVVGVESLGQHRAAECFEKARSAVAAEVAAIRALAR